MKQSAITESRPAQEYTDANNECEWVIHHEQEIHNGSLNFDLTLLPVNQSENRDRKLILTFASTKMSPTPCSTQKKSRSPSSIQTLLLVICPHTTKTAESHFEEIVTDRRTDVKDCKPRQCLHWSGLLLCDIKSILEEITQADISKQVNLTFRQIFNPNA